MQKIKKTLIYTLSAAFFGLSMVAGSVFVAAQPAAAVECSILPTDVCSKANDGTTSGGVFSFLKWVLVIMNALVGVAAVGGVIWAGILYTSAGDKADQVKKAKTIIIDVVIGLVAYGLMFLALNWIVPGGVFK